MRKRTIESINKTTFTGDLYDEQQLLSWLLTQKNPAGDVIEALEGQDLLDLIEESSSLAVYFCELPNKYLLICTLYMTPLTTLYKHFLKR